MSIQENAALFQEHLVSMYENTSLLYHIELRRY
jgi:hypothetical protein